MITLKTFPDYLVSKQAEVWSKPYRITLENGNERHYPQKKLKQITTKRGYKFYFMRDIEGVLRQVSITKLKYMLHGIES